MASSSHSSGPALALPSPTKDSIVLKIHVMSCRNIYRTIRVPANYSFKLLHKLIQYAVGWADIDGASHRFMVHGPVEIYMHSPRGDTIKNWGQGLLGVYQRSEHDPWDDGRPPIREADIHQAEEVLLNPCMSPQFNSIHEKRDAELKRKREQTYPLKEETEVCIADVWKKALDQVSIPNKDIVIRYIYGIWVAEIHWQSFKTLTKPSDQPFIIDGDGGPVVEGAPFTEDFDGYVCKPGGKKFHVDRFNTPGYWNMYLEGDKVYTVVREHHVALLVRGDADPDPAFQSDENEKYGPYEPWSPIRRRDRSPWSWHPGNTDDELNMYDSADESAAMEDLRDFKTERRSHIIDPETIQGPALEPADAACTFEPTVIQRDRSHTASQGFPQAIANEAAIRIPSSNENDTAVHAAADETVTETNPALSTANPSSLPAPQATTIPQAPHDTTAPPPRRVSSVSATATVIQDWLADLAASSSTAPHSPTAPPTLPSSPIQQRQQRQQGTSAHNPHNHHCSRPTARIDNTVTPETHHPASRNYTTSPLAVAATFFREYIHTLSSFGITGPLLHELIARYTARIEARFGAAAVEAMAERVRGTAGEEDEDGGEDEGGRAVGERRSEFVDSGFRDQGEVVEAEGVGRGKRRWSGDGEEESSEVGTVPPTPTPAPGRNVRARVG